MDLVSNKGLQLLQKVIRQYKITEVQFLYKTNSGELNLFAESLQYNIFINLELSQIDLIGKKEAPVKKKKEIDIFNVTEEDEEELLDDLSFSEDIIDVIAGEREEETVLRFSTESSIVEIMALAKCTVEASEEGIGINSDKSMFRLPYLSTIISIEDLQELKDVNYVDELDTSGVVIANTLNKLDVPLSMQFIGIKDGKIYTHSDRVIIEKTSWVTKHSYILNMQSISLLKMLTIFQGESIFINQQSENFLTTHIKVSNIVFKSVSSNIEVIESILTLLNESNVTKVGTILDYSIIRVLDKVSPSKDNIVEIISDDKGNCMAKKDGNIVMVSAVHGFRSNISIVINLNELEAAVRASGKPNPALGLLRENNTDNLILYGIQKVLIPCEAKG